MPVAFNVVVPGRGDRSGGGVDVGPLSAAAFETENGLIPALWFAQFGELALATPAAIADRTLGSISEADDHVPALKPSSTVRSSWLSRSGSWRMSISAIFPLRTVKPMTVNG